MSLQALIFFVSNKDDHEIIDVSKNVMHPCYFKNRELHIEGYIVQN